MDAAVTNSPLWRYVEILPLTINMRLSATDTCLSTHEDIAEFSQCVTDLGDGRLPTTSYAGESEPFWIEIPSEFLIIAEHDKVVAIVDIVYTDFQNNFSEQTYLRTRAILSPTNEIVDEINRFILTRVPGDETEYLSCDTISRSINTTTDADLLYPLEVRTLEFH